MEPGLVAFGKMFVGHVVADGTEIINREHEVVDDASHGPQGHQKSLQTAREFVSEDGALKLSVNHIFGHRECDSCDRKRLDDVKDAHAKQNPVIHRFLDVLGRPHNDVNYQD